MAEGIIVLRTPPGLLPRPGHVRVGRYQVLFVYEIDPVIQDYGAAHVISPTPLASLVQTIGQSNVDLYVPQTIADSFDDGSGAWEYVHGSRRTIVTNPETGERRLETLFELVDRLTDEFSSRKAEAISDWRDLYEFSGRTIIIP